MPLGTSGSSLAPFWTVSCNIFNLPYLKSTICKSCWKVLLHVFLGRPVLRLPSAGVQHCSSNLAVTLLLWSLKSSSDWLIGLHRAHSLLRVLLHKIENYTRRKMHAETHNTSGLRLNFAKYRPTLCGVNTDSPPSSTGWPQKTVHQTRGNNFVIS